MEGEGQLDERANPDVTRGRHRLDDESTDSDESVVSSAGGRGPEAGLSMCSRIMGARVYSDCGYRHRAPGPYPGGGVLLGGRVRSSAGGADEGGDDGSPAGRDKAGTFRRPVPGKMDQQTLAPRLRSRRRPDAG